MVRSVDVFGELACIGMLVTLAITGCAPGVSSNAQPRIIREIETDVSTDTIGEIAVPLSNVQRSRVVAVCPQPFLLALEPWVQRRRQEGLDVTIIDSQPTAINLKQSLTVANDGSCKYVLLVGDSQLTTHGAPSDPNQFVPTIYLDADATAPYQQAPQLPGDYGYGDFDGDGVADAAVGRLPIKTAEQLTVLINRIIAYEESSDFGRWRSRVDLVAGIGGFGPVIDGAIEMVAGGIVTGSLPGSVRTRITHASPTSDFHPGTAEFTPTVLRNYEDGARFWVYAGHGWIDELDRVPGNQFGRPVLSMSDLPRLQRPHQASPIALMLACYTGAFDAPSDCLAERMLLADQGPIAVLAGSRVTMPYGNAATAIGLINAVYETDATRLGDAWLSALQELALTSTSNPELQARRMMIDGIASILGGGAAIDEERCEHMQLYNWLGDPTLRLAANESVEIAEPADAVAGQPWFLQGTVPMAGELTIEVHRRLGSPLPLANTSAPRHEAANDTVLVSRTMHVEPGEWNCEIDDMPLDRLKPTSSVPIVIKVDLVGREGFATGSRTAWLRAQPKPSIETRTSGPGIDAQKPASR